MKAAVVHDFTAALRIEDLPIPEPGPGEVLVKIETSGLCHTDIHAAHGDWPVKPSLPLIPGHEGVGIVAALGQGVTEVSEGQRVAIPWLGWACGRCEYCVSGWETSASSSATPGTRSTAAMPSTRWLRPVSSLRCPTPSTRWTPHPSPAPVSPPTRRSRFRRRGLRTWSPCSASAAIRPPRSRETKVTTRVSVRASPRRFARNRGPDRWSQTGGRSAGR